MKYSVRSWLMIGTLALCGSFSIADAIAETTRPAVIKYSVYGGEELVRVAQDWNATFPSSVAKGATQTGSFPMYNTYSQYSTNVTYQNNAGERCKFTAGYVLNNTGPVFSSSAEKLTSGAYCSISIYPRYSKPYEFTMDISMF
ncbi:hypothetical protein ABRP92_12720 [Pectobacterium aroidearum]|uniref:hypothetical protein n=1 Tax=Pectobacterium aroidearum TaxID=1201031 RepID=UPI0032ED8FD7